MSARERSVAGDAKLVRLFWGHVGVVGNVCECWPWNGALDRKGYGHAGRGKAHRIAYELSRGPIPDGLHIDHLCRVRECVNPWHMEPVTNLENLRRGESLTWKKPKLACPRGHLYSGDNLYQRGQRRECRICRASNKARRRAERSMQA